MTQVEKLARFAVGASFESLSNEARDRLKVHILDTLGCAIGAIGGEPVKAVRGLADEFKGERLCTLIGGGRSAPDRATLYNGTLVRYLDFMDNFLGKKETCHPCDNLAAILAAAEYADASGQDLMTAVAVGYQVQCRLAETAPVMEAGFDHTTHLALSIPAGVSRALGMNENQAANAIAMAGSQLCSLAVIRAAPNSQLKGFASAVTASTALQATFLARKGVTGPLGLIESPKGLAEATGSQMKLDWEKEKLDVLPRCILKRFNSEVHTQSTLENLLELRSQHGIDPDQIETVRIDVFRQAYEIVGNGEYGNRHFADTKEQADHSLPYLAAVMLLDGEVWPEQFEPSRIKCPDVQDLMRRIDVETPPPTTMDEMVDQADPYTAKYPDEMPNHVRIVMKGGQKFEAEKRDYAGFRTRPMTWDQAMEKYRRLGKPADAGLLGEIAEAVRGLEEIQVRELTGLLERV